MSRTLYFTVDVDRDCNIPIRGTSAAGSIDRGAGEAPRFSSSAEGLPIIADLLDDLGIKGTFFIEGRTAEVIDSSCLEGHCIGLHGYDHEDLTGKETGVVPDVREVLRKGFDAVSDAVSAPICFRAPYMSADPGVMEAVKGIGIRADSSVYTDIGGPTAPYQSDGMTVYPVPRAKDRSGKAIAAYLWPMHEGKRRPEDYIEMASGLEHMVLATHSWHMTESRDGGKMAPERAEENLRNVRRVLEGILDLGFGSGTIRPQPLRMPSSSTLLRARTLLTGARILADR